MTDQLFALPPPTLLQQIAEVEREIGMRELVYPRQVAAKKMTQQKADWLLTAMRAVLATLKSLDAGEGEV